MAFLSHHRSGMLEDLVKLQQSIEQIPHPVDGLIVGLGRMTSKEPLVVELLYGRIGQCAGVIQVPSLSCGSMQLQEERYRAAVRSRVGPLPTRAL